MPHFHNRNGHCENSTPICMGFKSFLREMPIIGQNTYALRQVAGIFPDTRELYSI
jgi:hypothetical protein